MTPTTIGHFRFLPNVIGVDPATATGCAWLEGAAIRTMTIDLGGGDWPTRAYRLFKAVERFEADGDTTIAYECAIQSRRTHYAHEHGMLRGALECAARERGLPPPLYFNVTTIKSFATGNGAADKLQMMKACKTLIGVTPANDNEADAIWVLALASHTLLGGVIHDLKPKKRKPVKRKVKSETRLF